MLESDSTDSSMPAAETAAPAPRKRAPRKASAKAGPPTTEIETAPAAPAPRKRAPRKSAAPAAFSAGPSAEPTELAAPEPAAATAPAAEPPAAEPPAAEPAAAKAPAKRAPRKAAKAAPTEPPRPETVASGPAAGSPAAKTPAETAETVPAKRAPRKRAAKKVTALDPAAENASDGATPTEAAPEPAAAMTAPSVLFMAPSDEPAPLPRRRRVAKKAAGAPVSESDSDASPTNAPPTTEADPIVRDAADPDDADSDDADSDDADSDDETADPEDVREAAIEQASGARRRRRRGRRGRGGASRTDDDADDDATDGGSADADDADDESVEDKPSDAEDSDETGANGTRRRRRRRRSAGGGDDSGDGSTDDPPNTVTHVRDKKSGGRSGSGGGSNSGGNSSGGDDDGVRGIKGSTRLEAKRQRRRDGRETTRRRAPILTEAEFLARREAVDRVMAVRQNGDRTQIAVLEDNILVEHYVTRASATSYVGNVYLGRVQNVLPSMEAAFIDIGKGRNGVLYAGEVNWDAAGLDGKSRTIEHAMKSGDSVLVQVTKDPIGHKGARLTSQVSLPGRFLVYVPGGGMTGISRRLPDTERHRLKSILKKIVPDEAGVIVRTAAEGASEEDLTRDVERLQAQWESIKEHSQNTQNAKSGTAPSLLHGEPDLAIRVVRDVFNEDFGSLVVEGDEAWSTISGYLEGVAPDLAARAARHTKDTDLFHDLRVDEQLMKALDRKVWLPSGGSLVIDRTEAMTVVDVNTGKYVGSGGNLEQTVTRNNLEAAEEIVRQLRLRDVGGIVVIDFIDMVLESNRDLVLRRLTECLGRDRTKHQVAEVTSLGLVQMTRKRVGEGLLEAFSEPCEHCHGRGVLIHTEPVDQSDPGSSDDDDRPQGKGKRRRGGRGGGADAVEAPVEPPASPEQRQAANAAIAAIHRATAAEQAAAAVGEAMPVAGSDSLPDAADGDLIATLATNLVAAAREAESPSAVESEQPATAAAEPESDSSEPAASAPESVRPEPESDEAVVAEHDAPSAPGRRRRRAASRPAGPPVAAG